MSAEPASTDPATADPAAPADMAAIAARYSLDVELRERLPELRHEFSHYSLVMHPRVAAVRRAHFGRRV